MRCIEADVRNQQTFPGCIHSRVALSEVEQEPFHRQFGLIENVEMKGFTFGQGNCGLHRPSGSDGPPKRGLAHLKPGKRNEESLVAGGCR